MTSETDRNVLNCGKVGLDTTIYRIISLDRFYAMLVSKSDALSNPNIWDDPFEDILMSHTKVQDGSDLIDLTNLAGDWFGQCWSTFEETDAMWRIYSPERRGLKVKSTIRKVFENLKNSGIAEDEDRQCFVGIVKYLPESDILALMSRTTFTGTAWGGQNDGFASLLCLKRETFAHEAEVRILFNEYSHAAKRGSGGYVSFDLNPNNLFDDELVLDPRCKDHEFQSYKSILHALGWKGAIIKSNLYQMPNFTIQM